MDGNGKKLAGVMGWPIGHSLSPMLHKYWLAQNNLDGDYLLLKVAPENLEDELRALPGRGFTGVNITVPHKEAALAAVQTVDESAARIGAVNAVTVRPDGTLHGRNTDVTGFLDNLKAAAPQWRAAEGPIVVLGAGGAARAVVAALLGEDGAEIRLLNRNRDRAEKLAHHLGPNLSVLDWEKRHDALAGAALVVNATSLGMTGNPGLDLDLGKLPPAAVVNDIVYRPLATPLLQAAAARGHTVADGLGMLMHQARPCFEEWFGGRARVTAALRAALVTGLEASG